MGEGGVSLLVRWANFYVITGSAAAALTGLQFVVITLGAQRNRGNVEANRAFGTPTIIHFCAVLLIAALILQGNPPLALFVVAGVTLLLLFIGIHNAWDAATFIALNQQQPEE